VIGSPLDPQCTFDSYVEGSSNRVALAAAKTIAEAGTGAVRFNPLFIYSNRRAGQDASAAGDRQRRAQPACPQEARRLSDGGIFHVAVRHAIRDNDALSLKESLRNIDLLVIDDMQFLQGKKIQHEFCHLLNMLLDSARQVVVAADRAAARELESLDPRVRSRLQGGVALEIGAPDYEMRLDAAQRLAIARRTTTLDIKRGSRPCRPEHHLELPGAGGRVQPAAVPPQLRAQPDARAGRRHSRPSRQCGRAQAGAHRGHPAGGFAPLQCVAAGLLSDRRTRVIVKPRQIAMYLAKTMTPRSFPEIGRRFGGRDHTTVLHAVRKIEELINSDTKLGHEIELLKRLIIE
jgi:chromosomal replication initiator protein